MSHLIASVQVRCKLINVSLARVLIIYQTYALDSQ